MLEVLGDPRGKLNLGLVVARGHVGPGDTLPRWESESRGALKGHSGVARPTREPLKGAAMLGAWAAMAILAAPGRFPPHQPPRAALIRPADASGLPSR